MLTLVRRIVVGAILLLFAVLAFRIGSILKDNYQIEEVVKIRTDTLIIRDTVKIEKPVYITKVVLDSILVAVPVVDTLPQTDTIFINLPREQRYYKDNDYEAWVSGYHPELDSLNIFRKEKTVSNIYRTKYKEPRFSIGLQIGYGISIQNNTLKTSPYLGIGINYRLF